MNTPKKVEELGTKVWITEYAADEIVNDSFETPFVSLVALVDETMGSTYKVPCRLFTEADLKALRIADAKEAWNDAAGGSAYLKVEDYLQEKFK